MKVFKYDLYPLREEFRMGFVAISTTVSGNDGFLKMSRRISTSLDPIGVDLGEIGGIWSWAHTGTEWRPGEEFKDECTTVEEGVMACSDVSQAWWPWFPEILDFWKVSPTDPGERTAPGSCKTGTENEFPRCLRMYATVLLFSL